MCVCDFTEQDRSDFANLYSVSDISESKTVVTQCKLCRVGCVGLCIHVHVCVCVCVCARICMCMCIWACMCV